MIPQFRLCLHIQSIAYSDYLLRILSPHLWIWRRMYDQQRTHLNLRCLHKLYPQKIFLLFWQLNSAYGDHYITDPSSGGFTTFTGGDQLTGGYDQEAAIKRYRNLKKEFPESKDDVLWEMANYSDPSTRKNKNAQSYMQMLSGMMPQGSYPNEYMQEE